MTWLSAMEDGMKVALYCSDVSGAFDRVASERLVAKLVAKGMRPQMVRVVASWLETRRAHVVVEGSSSDATDLLNMVFQGTVWGPILWNCFFEDVRLAVADSGFSEVVYADDMNCYKEFAATVGNAHLHTEMQARQSKLHSWGAANQVVFDPGKESFHIIHATQAEGEGFTSLGVGPIASWLWVLRATISLSGPPGVYALY